MRSVRRWFVGAAVLPVSAGLAVTGCSGSTDMTAVDKARIQFCAEVGSQLMIMMQIGNGDTGNLTPESVRQGAAETIASADAVERVDDSAPVSLAEDTQIAFTRSNETDIAAPALTRITDYCKAHNMDPMGGPTPQ
ncbi:hypothetical protein ABZX77_15250 [Streptomyces sp. NPDC004237]|uniref:hypothetical protein n=1 Tax=Streptomyces sp. NPDC004237 TaxID=3154455 RepID=UPI0033BE510D